MEWVRISLTRTSVEAEPGRTVVRGVSTTCWTPVMQSITKSSSAAPAVSISRNIFEDLFRIGGVLRGDGAWSPLPTLSS